MKLRRGEATKKVEKMEGQEDKKSSGQRDRSRRRVNSPSPKHTHYLQVAWVSPLRPSCAACVYVFS